MGTRSNLYYADQKSRFYDEDFTKLANYMTKTKNKRKTIGRKQRKTATKRSKLQPCEKYAVTRTEIPKTCTLAKRSKTQKGYYIANSYEGINPATGMRYRRYTLIRIHRRI